MWKKWQLFYTEKQTFLFDDFAANLNEKKRVKQILGARRFIRPVCLIYRSSDFLFQFFLLSIIYDTYRRRRKRKKYLNANETRQRSSRQPYVICPNGRHAECWMLYEHNMLNPLMTRHIGHVDLHASFKWILSIRSGNGQSNHFAPAKADWLSSFVLIRIFVDIPFNTISIKSVCLFYTVGVCDDMSTQLLKAIQFDLFYCYFWHFWRIL